MSISIIIPTLNEEHNIGKLLSFLVCNDYSQLCQIIVVDGGSVDATQTEVRKFESVTLILSSEQSRAIQMNLGAKYSNSDVLYFVHADVVLPPSFYTDIMNALKTSQYGGYRYRFDSENLLLRINSFFTRFPMMWCRGGDQTLFITRDLFDQLNGFDEYYCVMEDFDLLRRAKQMEKYHIIQKDVIVSARKYHHNSYFNVQLANLRAFRMFNAGVEPKKIRTYYKLALGLKDY